MNDSDSRVLHLVEEALDSGRTPEAVCHGCPELLADVRRLFERCRHNDVELNELFSPPPTRPPAAPAEGPGTVVGPYTLLEQIGEGGFGTVYSAEQAWPVRRRVAVKVVKLGMDTKDVITRFEAERQALALMDHPNIARVFDAGATDAGRPYFVMELVDGVPITAHCDADRLTARQRLELMVLVCRAVQSAHQKGVIHRDLKPSNVLVTVHDGAPVPKVIDFGVAKATAASPADQTLLLTSGGFVGTPAYMSPEQAESFGLGVDTRTDVYGLGVILYELLTGTTPIDPHALKAAGHGGVAQLIREAEPPKPSDRLSAVGDALSAVAAARGSDPRRLGQQVRGEVDWIVMKALEKDRARRYDTAAALADDLARHLAGDPVAAGPPGRAYRVRKFARKYRAAIGVAALFATALVLGIAGTTLGLVRESRQRLLAEDRLAEADDQRRLAEVRSAEADVQRRSAQAVVAFLTKDVLAKASPRHTKDKTVRDTIVQSLIEPALLAVDKRFGDQPLVRAAVQSALATTLIELGRYDLAVPQAEAAWRARQAALGDDDPETIAAVNLYAGALDAAGRHAEAEPLFRRAWEWRRRALGDDHPDAVESLESYAVTLQSLGRSAEAEPLARRAWEWRRLALGDDDLNTLRAQTSYAWALRSVGRPAEAVPLARQAWERRRRLLGGDHPDTNRAQDDYARALTEAGRPAEARPLAEEAWGHSRRVLGDDHPDTVRLQYGYALTLVWLGRRPEAEPLFHQAFEASRRAQGDEHFVTLSVEVSRGQNLLNLGRPAEAEPLLRQAWEALRRTRGDDDRNTLLALRTYAQTLARQGRWEAAEPLFRQAWERGRRVVGADHPDTILALRNYAATLAKQGRWEAASPLCDQAWGSLRRVRGDDHPETILALNSYAATLLKHGGLAAAKAPFVDAVAAVRRSGRAAKAPFAELLFAQADFLRQSGDSAAAVPPLREATDVLRTVAPDDPNRGRDLYWLGTCLMAAHRPADAEPVFRENYVYDLKHPRPDRPAMPGSLEGLIASLKAQNKPADIEAVRSQYRPNTAAVAAPAGP